MSEAFDKSCRLLEKASFSHAFSNGLRNHGKYFLVVYCENSPGSARLGIAVSRKVSKRAVERNRIKRQIRESFRLNRKILKGMDCVVVAKQAAANIEKPVLRSSLDAHWRKISENA
ncbi:MAG: ribonuclease P protein component [Gammaproteobacteria bacterium]|nr:ribonuclease P protein component [Gammaproteobacteria bacterium]MDX2486993.1 ribonuclease P protein component [Gammaproteobacteria bacterium]